MAPAIQHFINIIVQYSTEGCVNVELRICLIKRHSITAYGEVGNRSGHSSIRFYADVGGQMQSQVRLVSWKGPPKILGQVAA
jgi:hypothetical protein